MADQPLPASASTSASTSFWSRSKQAIGSRSFAFLQHQPKPARTLSESQATEAASHQPARLDAQTAKTKHTRRREQVRRAQRNHRERKENYIKTLEEEVLRMRNEEATIISDSKALQEENTVLKDILTRHGIVLPDRAMNLSSFATVSVREKSDGAHSLQVTMPEMADYSYSGFYGPPSPFSTSASVPSPDAANATLPQMSQQTAQAIEEDPRTPPTAPEQYSSNPTGLAHPQIGIDFVLCLEQPCLGHTRGDLTSEIPSGHALTAQAPLLTTAPTRLSASAKWQVPAIEIERLLELSSQLNLLGEVTPVQAWARIRNHPCFDQLGQDGLEALKSSLLARVHCYGFGAVIDEDEFQDLLERCFN